MEKDQFLIAGNVQDISLFMFGGEDLEVSRLLNK